MARDDLTWISLVDFSPGIYTKYGAATTLGKDGAARVEAGTTTVRYTYGCYGDPDGGLRPLPGLVRSYTKDTHDVTEHTGYIRPHQQYPDGPGVGAPPGFGALNGTTFRQHPTTRAIGTGDNGRRSKIGVIDMLVETAQPLEKGFLNLGEPDPDYTEAGYRDREGISRPDQVHMITCFRQDPVPTTTDPDSMFPRYGRLRSQWRRFMLGHYDPSIGVDLYDYEWMVAQHADMAEEDSWDLVDTTNLPHYISMGSAGFNEQRLVIWPGSYTGTPPYPVEPDGYKIPTHMTNVYGEGTQRHTGWGRGNLAKGRGVSDIPNSADINLNTIQNPGINVIVGCFQSYTPQGTPAGPLEEYLANFWTYVGGDNIIGEGQHRVMPHWDSGGLDVQSSPWTYTLFPEYLVEHQDLFVGIIRDYGALSALLAANRGGRIHPRSTYMFTWPNAMRVLWRGTGTTDVHSGIDAQYADMWFWRERQDTTPGMGVRGEYLSVPPNTTNYYVPGIIQGNPITPAPAVPGNQIGLVSAVFSWQNTLVFVPAYGEGSVIKGGIDAGAVVRTGTIIPTGDTVSNPVSIPTGVVYGSREGVAFWDGEKAQIISPQLDGDFWIADDANECRPPDGYRWKAHASMGRFGYLYPFLYAPNNWVMDTRTGGWSRLVDPDDPNPYTHIHYHANEFGDIYAARGCYDDTNTDVLGLFSSTTRATRFQWVSQPLMSTINREQTVERLNLVAQGTGTVRVTLVGIDGTEQSETFDVDSTRTAQQIITPTSMHASDLTVIIDSQGVDGGEAPTIHALHLGARPDRELTRTP